MSTATILVVSDDPLLLACTETTLENAGYHVLSGHPAEALGIAHELQPAAIVLDSRRPNDGAALWARLHALQATAAIPVLLLIARTPQGPAVSSIPRVAEQPAAIDLERLATAVARCVQAQGTDALRSRVAPLSPQGQPPPFLSPWRRVLVPRGDSYAVGWRGADTAPGEREKEGACCLGNGAGRPVCIGRAESLLGAIQRQLGRPRREVKRLGYFLKGEPVAGAQQQAGALGRGQCGERLPHRLLLGAPQRQVGRGVCPPLLVAGGEGQPPPATAVAQRVEGRVRGDAVEPGGQRWVRCAREGRVRPEEGVLGEVFGLLDVPHHPKEIAIDLALVAGEHLVKGGGLLSRW